MKRVCTLAVPCILTLGALACSSSRPSVDPLAAFQKATIPAEYQQDPSIFLLCEDRVFLDGESMVHERRLVKELLRSDDPDEAQFHFSMDKFHEIVSIQGRALYPDGHEYVLNDDDFVDVPNFGNDVLYSEAKTRAFRFPGTSAGTIIDVTVKWRVDNSVYWRPAIFQLEQPILTRRYVLVHPPGVDFSVHATGMPETPTRHRTLKDGNEELVWERYDIPAFDDEEKMPPAPEYVPALWFSARGDLDFGGLLRTDSWADIAEWYEHLSDKCVMSTPAVVGLVDSLCSHTSTDRERAERIFYWVETNIRYVAIYLGLDGYRPHLPDDILRNRYGDCKDQSVVVVAALRCAGLQAHLVAVRTKDLGHIPAVPPTPTYFNHVIVQTVVEDDTLYLDPTCGTCDFGLLPPPDRGADALVVGGGSGDLTTLPVRTPSQNNGWIATRISIGKNGDAVIHCRTTFNGDQAAYIRERFSQREGASTRDVAENLFERGLDGATLDSISVEGKELGSHRLKMTMRWSFLHFLDTTKEVQFVPIVMPSAHIAFPSCKDRVYPILLGEPARLEYEASMELPQGWQVADVPAAGHEHSAYFDYACRWSGGARELRMTRTWTVNGIIVPPAECREAEKQIEAIRRLESTRIPVRKAP